MLSVRRPLALPDRAAPADGTLAWATDEAADDFLWRCAGEPDQWKVAFRPRDRHREYAYDMGMAEFLWSSWVPRATPCIFWTRCWIWVAG